MWSVIMSYLIYATNAKRDWWIDLGKRRNISEGPVAKNS
jgi:hypothetical protein